MNQIMIMIHLQKKKKRVKKQISRNFSTKFLLGTTVTATHSSTHYQRSSLVQEGVQIPCVVNAKLIGTKRKINLSKVTVNSLRRIVT